MRTPDEIRDHAIKAFNQTAPAKYDEGQRVNGGLLDNHPDLIGAIREELTDGLFYVESLRHQLDEKDKRIAALERDVERWKELAKR